MKKIIDNETYNYILNILNNNGISNDIILSAKKMDTDLVKLFHDKIFLAKTQEELEHDKEVISNNLLGIYGNYTATLYYKGLGYNVENEYPVYDEKGNMITKADIAFYDRDNKLNLCEVKLASQIIDNIRNYRSDKEELYNGKVYYDMDDDIIKYKRIGDKLLTQSKKLKQSGHIVNVVIFSGCYMDDIIKDNLEKEIGVNIKLINMDFNLFEEQLKMMVENISGELVSNVRRKVA